MSAGQRAFACASVTRTYRKARIDAAKETGIAKKDFPETCPYSFDDIKSRPFPFQNMAE